MGNVALSNVNVVDNLVATFVAPANFTVSGISSTALPVASAFNGNSNTSLLAAGAASRRPDRHHHRHRPRPLRRPALQHTATASGVSPAAATVTDVSQNGTNPDPDGDGNPGNNNQPTIFDLPTSIAQIPTLTPWGAAILVLFLALAAWHQLRRRRRA